MKIFLSNIKRVNFKYKLDLLAVCAILFSIPILFWFNGKYYLGGDDSMLYYVFPKEMILNTLRLNSVNPLSGLGIYVIPFYVLLLLTKIILPFINTQAFFYGLNLSLGFLFFYLLINLIFLKKNTIGHLIGIFSSLFYILSVFSFTTLWSGTYVVYLITIIPLSLFLFLRAVKRNSIISIFLLSLILSAFAILVFATPWLLLALIAITPVFFIVFLETKKKFFKFILILFVLFALFNSYWLIPMFKSVVSNRTGNFISSVSSKEETKGSIALIHEITSQNILTYPFLNLFYPNLATEGYKKFIAYHEAFALYNVLLAIVAIIPLIISKSIDKQSKKIYLSVFFSWMVLLYFFTVNIFGGIGLFIFQFLLEKVPGFTMFRNNYGKIAPAYPLIFAVLLAVSLQIIFNKFLSKRTQIVFLIILSFLSTLNALPFLEGKYFDNPIWSTKKTYPTISEFNQDYDNLTLYIINKLQSKKFFWFPATTVNYTLVTDKFSPNHYYSGVSPLQLVYGVSDIPGLLSMPGLSTDFVTAVKNKNYIEIDKILNKLNVNYIVLNKDISYDLQNSYLFSIFSRGDFYKQQKEIDISKFSVKVASFGNSYDLYKLGIQ